MSQGRARSQPLKDVLNGGFPAVRRVVHHKPVSLRKRRLVEQMDDICEQVLRWLSAQIDSILVGRDQDGSSWAAGIIDIDPSWQYSS
jgi:hypothetical protein